MPLIVLYQQRMGLSAAVLNAIFGLYALGLIPALLIGGRLSDRHGRRPLVLAGIALSIVATVTLMFGGDNAVLLALGRLLSGAASGLVFGTGTAWVKELSADADDASAGPFRATVAMTIGFCSGPVFAGLCGQWLTAPTVLPYLPHIVLLGITFAAVWRTPDSRAHGTSAPMSPATSCTPTRHHGVATHFALVLIPFAPWVFGTAAIALAYLPSLIADKVAGYAMAFSAVTVGLTALTGVLVQPLVRRLHRPGARLLLTSMATVVVSILCAAWAAHSAQPVLILVAAALLGVAYGFTQFSGLAEVQAIADARSLGTATSVYQVLSYAGFAFPFLLSLMEERTSLTSAVLLLATAAIASLAAVWLAVITARYTH